MKLLQLVPSIACVAALAVSVLPSLAGTNLPASSADAAKSAIRFAKAMPEWHITHHALDDEIATLACSNFIYSLDPADEIFTADDLAAFRRRAATLDDSLRKGDISFAYDAIATFQTRMASHTNLHLPREFPGDILERYLASFAAAYDEHSTYMAPDTAAEMQQYDDGSICGIGIEVRVSDKALRIQGIVPGGPASLASDPNRLFPGDILVAVILPDGTELPFGGMTMFSATSQIRGRKGTPVTLAVRGPSQPTDSPSRRVTIVRDTIKLAENLTASAICSIRDSTGTPRKLGVINLRAFYAHTRNATDSSGCRTSAQKIEHILAAMRKENIAGLILDLRDNPGGWLPQAVEVAGLFLQGGPVVSVKSRRSHAIHDPDTAAAYTGPMLVLVNTRTASASEIVAGALRDYGRAIIVGTAMTHGKGTCQTTKNLGFASSLGTIRVTNLAYYRPNGECPNNIGIAPDILLTTNIAPAKSSFLARHSIIGTNALPPIDKEEYIPLLDLTPLVANLTRNVIYDTNALAAAVSAWQTGTEPARNQSKDAAATSPGRLSQDDVTLLQSLSLLSEMVRQCETAGISFDKPTARHRGFFQRIADWF